MTISTVVFDIGNVLIYWDRRNLYRKLIPDTAEMEKFLDEVCSVAWHEAQDVGASCADATAALKARFPEHEVLIDAPLVAAIHATHGRLIAWTVNDPARARQLAAWGVDGLCTDDVAGITAALATSG